MIWSRCFSVVSYFSKRPALWEMLPVQGETSLPVPGEETEGRKRCLNQLGCALCVVTHCSCAELQGCIQNWRDSFR